MTVLHVFHIKRAFYAVKDWPVMKDLYKKTKQRRSKIKSNVATITQKYLEKNQSFTNYVQEKNCRFTDAEFEQLLQDVNDVVQVCGQPSFSSSMMIHYLCLVYEKRYGTYPLTSTIPANC